MSVKTKIVVLHMKKLIFAGIAALLGILLILLLFLTLRNRESSGGESVPTLYVPGVYTSSVMIDQTAIDVQVAVDENHINSISLINLDESVETMYPLIKPTLEELSQQIITKQSVDDITYSKNNQYTSMLLLSAVTDALKKASP
ncbi:MAG: hypothetical protein MR508_09615 [Lachnospiraceae bacterium]|nr:hypothetical protein [Lachnospiraceae bacterium]